MGSIRRGIPAGVSTGLAFLAGGFTNVFTQGWSWPVGAGLAALVIAWVAWEVWQKAAESTAAERQPPGSASGEMRQFERAPAIPHQLPLVTRRFAGRTAELEVLSSGLRHVRSEPAGAVVIIAITGMAGVGKTALATHWAHTVAREFPDGQLYVDLRGLAPGAPVATEEVLRGFLASFGVPPQRIPASAADQAGLWRSLLAGRRVLVVLDNARDVEQVRPLLPGSGGCLVLVTSRYRLDGLVASEGALPLSLSMLPAGEAKELLYAWLGERLSDEPTAVEDIVASCAGLPLALAIVAVHALMRPGLTMARLASQLRDHRTETAGSGVLIDVWAAFAMTYGGLTPQAARLFRMFGLHPGPDLSSHAVASLAGVTLERARVLLAELVRTHLLVERAAGRFGCHDLVREYAADLANRTESERHRRAAIRRIIDHYVHSGYLIDQRLNPHRRPMALPRPRIANGVTLAPANGSERPVEWFRSEHASLLGTVRLAVTVADDANAWRLAWVLTTYLDRQGHWYDLAAVMRTGLDAAKRLGHAGAQGYCHTLLAGIHTHLGNYQEALIQAERSLAMYVRMNDLDGQANSHESLAILWERQGRADNGLAHARRALALREAGEDRRGSAVPLNIMGWCHALLEEYQDALAHCERAADLFREVDDTSGLAETRDSIGYIHHRLGHYREAVEAYEQALADFRRNGERHGEAVTLIHIGDSHLAAGDVADAKQAWCSALAILTELDYPDADPLRARLDAMGAEHDVAGKGGVSRRARRHLAGWIGAVGRRSLWRPESSPAGERPH